MPKIRSSFRNFKSAPYRVLNNKTKTLDFSWPELVHSAVMVGKANYFDVFRHGINSYYEIAFRVAILRANLIEKGGHIQKSDVYQSLDPSEKCAVSYFLGMGFSLAISDRMFGVSRLVHVDSLKRKLSITFKNGMRPDLIGKNKSGDWVVVEAKGRTNGFSKGAQEKAIKQVDSLGSIQRKRPVLKVASQSYFCKDLQIRVDDPDEGGEERELDFEDLDYYSEYYDIFSRAEGAQTESIFGVKASVIELKDFGVKIGVRESILEKLSSTQMDEDKVNVFEAIEWPSKAVSDSCKGYFLDGTFIELDEKKWSKNVMSKSPLERK